MLSTSIIQLLNTVIQCRAYLSERIIMFYRLVRGFGRLLGKLANVQMRILEKVGMAIVDGYTQTREKDTKVDPK